MKLPALNSQVNNPILKSNNKHSSRSRIISIVKLVLAACLLAFIIWKVDIGDFAKKLAEMNWWFFLMALGIHWIVVLIGTHRLQILLRAQDVHLGFWRTFKYNCIGYFFNLFSLGSTGGDLVKAFYVASETKERKTESVTVVFLDRIMGMTAVLIIAACVILMTMWQDNSFRPMLPAVLLFLFAGVISVIAIFTKNWWTRYISFNTLKKVTAFALASGCVVLILLKIFDFIKVPWASIVTISVVIVIGTAILITETQWRKIDILCSITGKINSALTRVIDALHNYRAHKLAAGIALFESISLQLLMCVIGWLFGEGLGFGIPIYAYFIVFPIATLVLSLPISPSGLGTGELAFIELFARYGIKDNSALAFALLLRMSMFSLSAVGFVFWLMPGTHIARKELEEKAEELEEVNDK